MCSKLQVILFVCILVLGVYASPQPNSGWTVNLKSDLKHIAAVVNDTMNASQSVDTSTTTTPATTTTTASTSTKSGKLVSTSSPSTHEPEWKSSTSAAPTEEPEFTVTGIGGIDVVVEPQDKDRKGEFKEMHEDEDGKIKKDVDRTKANSSTPAPQLPEPQPGAEHPRSSGHVATVAAFCVFVCMSLRAIL